RVSGSRPWRASRHNSRLPQRPVQNWPEQKLRATENVSLWPRLCEKSHGCYDSFFESAGGSDECQALWQGETGAKAHFYLPCLTTTWPRTIWFVRLMLSLKVLSLASLALVGLRRWKK